MWRACLNSMPLKSNLVCHSIINDPTCDRCKTILETPIHAPWHCSKLDPIRSDSVWNFRVSNQFLDFKELMSGILHHKKDPELFALLCGPSGTSRIKFTSLNWVVVLTTLPSLSGIDLRSFFWSSFPSNLSHRNLVSHGNHHHQIFSKSILMELYFQVRISLVLGLSFAILMVWSLLPYSNYYIKLLNLWKLKLLLLARPLSLVLILELIKLF